MRGMALDGREGREGGLGPGSIAGPEPGADRARLGSGPIPARPMLVRQTRAARTRPALHSSPGRGMLAGRAGGGGRGRWCACGAYGGGVCVCVCGRTHGEDVVAGEAPEQGPHGPLGEEARQHPAPHTPPPRYGTDPPTTTRHRGGGGRARCVAAFIQDATVSALPGGPWPGGGKRTRP